MLNQRGHGLGLRLGTRKSGCSGFAYVVDYADEIGAGDHTYASHGVTVKATTRLMIMETGTLSAMGAM